ncbi:MAG: hypothetical protein LCH61_09185 [Proteobacteria bacterium]|nr:hypothetical protein [Pseudomonadota bacterium]
MSGAGKGRRGVPRAALVARLWRTADRQVGEIETRLVEAGGDPASLERDAKTLAVLARTVRDLVALDQDIKARGKPRESDDVANTPRDFDDFRRRIAARMAELAAEGQGD